MFGKDDNVVTDEDVGNFVKQLETEGSQEIQDSLLGEDDEMVRDSTTASTGTQDKD